MRRCNAVRVGHLDWTAKLYRSMHCKAPCSFEGGSHAAACSGGSRSLAQAWGSTAENAFSAASTGLQNTSRFGCVFFAEGQNLS